MEKSAEYQGYWWLPDEPEEEVPGTLKFDPDEGASLNLLGSFKGAEDFGLMLDLELILGRSAKGEPITLQHCGETESNPAIGRGFEISSFHASTVFVGEHFQNPDDVGFEQLIVEYQHLDAWAGISGFESGTHPMMVRHTRPEPLTATVGGEYEVTLSFPSTLRSSSHEVTEVAITQRTELAIKFPEKKSLEHLLNIAYRLQHLLSLGTGKSAHPVAVWGITGSAGSTTGEAERVLVNYRSVARRGSDKKRPNRREMLFGLRDLPGGCGPTVERWLGRAEVLDLVNQLYLGTIYNPQSYIEQRFLNRVQALEVYHRRAMTSSDLLDEEHERRKEEILEAVADQHRDWLEERLRYSNEPNLRKRLREMFNEYPESVDLVVGNGKKERKSFINRVVATRNYLTHFDQSLEPQAARGVELYRITEELRLLVEIRLLGEIGFEAESIRERIKESASALSFIH